MKDRLIGFVLCAAFACGVSAQGQASEDPIARAFARFAVSR